MKTANKTSEFYRRLGQPAGDFSLKRRQQDVLFDKKWLRFLELARFFGYLPFIDFVFGAGSMALGNVHQDSDFDVIVGAKSGRIFTTRFFCVLMFGLLGRRRQKLSHKEAASDNICFNHFVAPESYCLRPPHNIYWQELYRNLVPIYGREEKIGEFFKANDWMGERIYPVRSSAEFSGFSTNESEFACGSNFSKKKVLLKTSNGVYSDDLRHKFHKPGFAGLFLEKILGGGFGDFIERFLKYVQVQRIKKSLKDSMGFEPRLVFNDKELEFHPDTLRIHKLLSNEK